LESKSVIAAVIAQPWRNASAFQKLVRSPPEGELDAIAGKLVRLNPFFLARKCKQIAPALVRRVLSQPVAAIEDAALTRNFVFLKEAVSLDVDDSTLLARWREALQALLDVNAYQENEKKRLQKLQGLARQPRVVAAMQAAAVGANPNDDDWGAMSFLEVLAIDGSEASADALMPHVHHAMTTGEGLVRIERLQAHAAASGPVRAMLAKVGEALDRRSAASPVTELVTKLGIEARDVVLSMSVPSRAKRAGMPVVQARVSMTARGAPYMHVAVQRGRTGTSFDDRTLHRDGLELGRADLDGLPDFFARTARKLGIHWAWNEVWVSSSLRGRKRQTVLRWLSGS